MPQIPGFGIALGGGGSRAFVHLGVLARLEEEGLSPSFVSGSSMGAFLGALYAADPNMESILPAVIGYFKKSSLFAALRRKSKGDGLHHRPGMIGNLARKFATASVATFISFRMGLRRVHPVNHAIDEWFGGGRDFGGLALPFGLNALNLTRGRVEEFTSGPLAPALKAGVAIGLIFAPHQWNDCAYADAAPICPVPVGLCRRLGARTVLAVDISAPIRRPQEPYSGFDVVRRILSVQSEMLNARETERADAALSIDVSDVFWADFGHIDSLVERGRRAAEEVLPGLREKLAIDN